MNLAVGILRDMRRYFQIIVFIAVLATLAAGPPASAYQYGDRASELLESMSSKERIGQLFLVSFEGSSIPEESPIASLIAEHHISGVVLRRESGNFVERPGTVEGIKALIQSLQEIEYSGIPGAETPVGEAASGVYVPLFIAMEHDGGEQAFQHLLSGLSSYPSAMAIGATWKPDLAQQSGSLLGKELEALGVNLYLGPYLDVLEDPQSSLSNGLGVRTFGGDPFWVGEMGRAFIQGVHQGSGGRVGTVARNFPGMGSSDRPVKEEVATIRKSLEQLKQIELAPFFEVTRTGPGMDAGDTDALLVSHIRYQGFQGNIRDTTRPVSLDPQAFSQLMALSPFESWRAEGGVTISDSLGSRAIRRFRDPREVVFQSHLVARDAFLAGNDVLMLTDFKDNSDEDEFATILTTLSFFESRYNDDPIFAQRVNEAVLRILNIKLRLYDGIFEIENINNARTELSEIGSGGEFITEVAQTSSTLLSPSQIEIEDRIGGAPLIGDRIVFFTDSRRARQCGTCDYQIEIDVNALQDAVIRLYGSTAGGEVRRWNLQSYSTADLANYLGQVAPTDPAFPITPKEELEAPLNAADWLVFSISNKDTEVYGSNALQLLLESRPDLARDKNVVVFLYNAPYVLDATEISKIDVLFSLYQANPESVDMAARLLFQEFGSPGAPPVSVPGTGYDLISMMAPDPDQVISLFVESGEPNDEGGSPGFLVGDVINIETGLILDHNANQVPDGTVVDFEITLGDTATPSINRAQTTGGVASMRMLLDRIGLHSITASSAPARISETLQINVQQDVPALATVISPTLQPTVTSEPTLLPDIPTVTPGEQVAVEDSRPADEVTVGGLDFVLGLLAVVLAGGIGYASSTQLQEGETYRARCILLPVIGALIGYNFIALGGPGSRSLLTSTGHFTGVIAAILGGAMGLFAAQFWCRSEGERRLEEGGEGSDEEK
jgi:beta-N-acetylhexosaminidase